MDLGVISIRYARALMKGATQMKNNETIYHEMISLSQAYANVPQLRHTIDNPMLPADAKKKVLIAACGNDVTELTERFFDLVLQEGRESVMQLIASSYISLYRKQKNIIHGRLITASAVSPDTERRLKNIVQQRTDGEVEFLSEVNPDIIGGFILEYDTYRMDASVQKQLRSILKQLK